MNLHNLIAGQWQEPLHLLDPWVCHASEARPLFQQRASSPLQIEQALACAAEVHARGDWERLEAEPRAELLERAAALLQQRQAAIAEADATATGVVIKLTSAVARITAAAFQAAAQLLREPRPQPHFAGPHGDLSLERLPLGVAAIIAPWNAPSGITAHKLASALAAGCPAIVKPSEWAPLSAQMISEALAEAGLPSGVLQLLHGNAATGAALVADPRVAAVSFTGGLAGGRAVAAACAEQIKPAQLELGGNNPLVVLKGANIEAAADGVVAGLTTLNGQWCRALGRLLVDECLRADLMDAVMQRLQAVRVGHALDPDSEMGPLVHRAQLQAAQRAVQAYIDMGGRLHRSTPMPELPGYFFPPTLISGLPGEQAVEEIFGPVATVHSFDGADEAVALANQSPYGLAAYVFGPEQQAWAVARRIRSGNIKINAVSMLNLHPWAPRPAWGLSGLGDEGIVETYEFFRGSRLIGVAGRPD